MASFSYQFHLASETFSHGAYQTQNFNRPELRAPSVKGMIRWWHQQLGYSESDACAIFGSVAGKGSINQASVVAIRVEPLQEVRTRSKAFMPHKGQSGGAKDAILPNTAYQLSLSSRRGGLSEPLEKQLLHATETWLMFGGIGQRSNRGSGSVIWDQAPTNQKDYEMQGAKLLQGSKMRFAFLGEEFRSSEEARDVAGRFPKHDPDSYRNPSSVPGAVFGSAGRIRKPSSLKLKTIPLGGTYKLLALWAPSDANDTFSNLSLAIEKMRHMGPKEELALLLDEVLEKFRA